MSAPIDRPKSIRISPDMFAEVQAVARAEGRSWAEQIRRLVRVGLDVTRTENRV